MILLALSKGVDGVLVVGCREGECHYQRGTYLGRSKLTLLGQMLAAMGLAEERVAFSEMGALERNALPRLLAGMAQRIRALAPAITVDPIPDPARQAAS
jgi:coenzyme F420-reducing hydrogenase delta subunit